MRGLALLLAGFVGLPGLVSADPVAGILTEWQAASCNLGGGCRGARCSMPPADYRLEMERDADTEGNDWRILSFNEVDFELNPFGRDHFMRPFDSAEEAAMAIPAFAPGTQVLFVIYPEETATADQIFEVIPAFVDPDQHRFRLICSGSLQ